MTWGGYTENSGDAHVYPVVPQPGEITGFLRSLGKDSKPVFLSEYGIGSSVDLWRVTRLFESFGKDFNLGQITTLLGFD